MKEKEEAVKTKQFANAKDSEMARPNKLAETDRLQLDLAKARRQTALAEAKTALANNENAELSYKYIVLQLYMKYGLSQTDALSEAGDIIYGGATKTNEVGS